MNAINKQTETLTRLIAEVVKLDSDKQCLAVELDYLIRHLQMYKQTCEDAKHHEEFPDHRMCECACCIDCGCCECEKEESEDGDWDGDLEDTPNCHECGEDCGRTIVTHHKYKNTYFCSQKCQRIYDGDQDNFTHRQCEYRECKNEFDLADPHYYDEERSVCYCCEECYKNDENESDDEEPEEESDDEEETPTCGFCGKDAGQSPIEHHKWDELYFCSQKCCDDYE